MILKEKDFKEPFSFILRSNNVKWVCILNKFQKNKKKKKTKEELAVIMTFPCEKLFADYFRRH